MSHFKFAKWDSVDAEMKRFTLTNQTDPEKGKTIYSAGEALVCLASNGSMSKLCRFLDETSPDSLLIYFVYKALKASLINGHLMISAYLVDCGYPLDHDGLPNIVKECLSELEDYLCVSLIRMLASKGLEVCKQAPLNWWTALHHAVQNKRVETVQLLIQLGADVNAVAEHDVMPLNLAQALPECFEKEEILKCLLASGAKPTWRRSVPIANSYTSQESTMMSVTPNNNKQVENQQPVEKKNFVKFTGGSDPSTVFTIPARVPQSVVAVSDVNNKVNEGVDAVITSVSHLELNSADDVLNSDDDHNKANFVVASDGGMMFSTGN